MGFELMTSSLPRMRSTPELHRRPVDGSENEVRTRDPQLGRLMLYQLSYFRDYGGRRWIRTTEGISQQIYSLPHLATLVFSRFFTTLLSETYLKNFLQRTSEPMEGVEPTTPRLQITCSGQLSYIGVVALRFRRDCKDRH